MRKSIVILLVLALMAGLCACGGAGGSAQVWEKAFYPDEFNQPTEEYYIGTARRISGTFNSDSVTDGKLEAELRVDAECISIVLYENGSDRVKNGGYDSIRFPITVKRPDGTKFDVTGTLESGGDAIVIPEDQEPCVLLLNGSEEARAQSVARALCAEEGELALYITREDQPATKYLFAVDCGNFAQLYAGEIAEPIQSRTYAQAEEALLERDYDRSVLIFKALGDYRDSAARVEEALEARNAADYAQAEGLLAEKDYDGAIAAFEALGDYRDSAARAEALPEEVWASAQTLIREGKGDEALAYLLQIRRYKDVEQEIQQCADMLLAGCEMSFEGEIYLHKSSVDKKYDDTSQDFDSLSFSADGGFSASHRTEYRYPNGFNGDFDTLRVWSGTYRIGSFLDGKLLVEFQVEQAEGWFDPGTSKERPYTDLYIYYGALIDVAGEQSDMSFWFTDFNRYPRS